MESIYGSFDHYHVEAYNDYNQFQFIFLSVIMRSLKHVIYYWKDIFKTFTTLYYILQILKIDSQNYK